jgi:hypothetical protein
MFGFGKPKPDKPLPRGLQAKILQRFPPQKFDVSADLTYASEAEWAAIFDRYQCPPDPLVTEEEAEDSFFDEAIAQPCRVGPPVVLDYHGAMALRPKQDILDLFADREKWILRTYFAATGLVRKTEFAKAQEHFLKTYPVKILPVTPRRQLTQEGGLDGSHGAYGVYQREYAHYINQTRQAEDHFRIAAEQWAGHYKERRREHMQRGGEWFYDGLERALTRKKRADEEAARKAEADKRKPDEPEGSLEWD